MIRRAAALATAILVLPAPAYAHVAGPGAGVEIELLLFGVALLVLGFFLRSSRTGKPWLALLVALAGLGLAGGAFALPRLGEDERSSNAVVQITEPRQGAVVQSGKPVRVKVRLQNGSLATTPTSKTGGHLHLFVDGKLQQMPYSTQARVNFEPGRHSLMVEYVDAQHVSFEPRVLAEVDVTAR